MTENKRFTYSNTYGWQNGAFLEVMNGLHEKNRKLKKQIKQHEKIISEQAIQLDYLQDENKHMKDVLNENKQLQPFIELANKYDKTIDELYQFIQSYLNSRNENNYWNPKNLRG